MKRYFIVNEFFGSRVYDSAIKKERYYNEEDTIKIKKELEGNYVEISNNTDKSISAPLKISMNITKGCNLRCKQCFSNSGEIQAKELTTEDMYTLFDNMQKYGTYFIAIGGGEPLTRKDLLDILEYGKKKQLAISIVSNGLLLTKELIQELNKMDLDTFWVSLDGLEENHEYLRGKGTFKRAIEAIKLLKQEFNSKIAIRLSLSKRNINEWKDVLKIAEDLGVDLIRYTPLLSFGRAKNEDLMISQDQYISFLKEIENIESSINVVHPNVTNSSKFWVNPEEFGCHCGKEAIWIDEVGNCSPCIFFGEDFNVGNITQEDYIDLWKKCKDISKYEGNDTCRQCGNYKRCRGGCRARVLDQNGNWNGVDPLCPLRKNII
jgi:radical SAM protein with 4Fe4S-binding SPASM domain